MIVGLYILALVALLGIALSIYPIIIRWSVKNGYVAAVNWRSAHKRPIPTTGGVIFIFAWVVPLCFFDFGVEFYAILVGYTALIVGWLDDRMDIKWYVKLGCQVLIGGAFFKLGFRVDHLHGLFLITDLNPAWSALISIALVITLMNAINLIDGVDGLAGMISLLFFGFFSIWFLINGQMFWFVYAGSIAVLLMAFLVYNYHPARVFMGDTGSLFLGANAALFMIIFLREPPQEEFLMPFALLALPVIDMVRLFLLRMVKGKSPFEADRNHYHHQLIAVGSNHKEIANSGGVLSLLYLVFSWLLMTYLAMHIAMIMLFCTVVMGYLWVNVRSLTFYSRSHHSLTKRRKSISDQNYLLKLKKQSA